MGDAAERRDARDEALYGSSASWASLTTARWRVLHDYVRWQRTDNALVALPAPVSRFPDHATVVAQKLKAAVPTLGTRRLADTLARAGLHLSRSTVGRLLARSLSKAPPPGATTSTTEEPARGTDASGSTTADAARRKTESGRTVTARYPHHLWHLDRTVVPTIGSFWVPWFPFSLPQCWPFAFDLAVVLDQFSRSVVAWKLFCNQPSARAIYLLIDDARDAVGQAPKYIVSDQGAQFQNEYRGWCDDNDVVPRFGAIGQSGSIAVLERFFQSFKEEMLRGLVVVPRRCAAMQREVMAYTFWYNQHRPSQALGARTPAEVRHGGVPASKRTRGETRARFAPPRGRGAGRVRRVRGTLELVVERVDRRKHLPIVSLRQAA